jgi:hypothetical protein
VPLNGEHLSGIDTTPSTLQQWQICEARSGMLSGDCRRTLMRKGTISQGDDMVQSTWMRALVVGLLLMSAAAVVPAQTVYDDFAGNRIDPDLWSGVEEIQQSHGLDSLRTVKAGRLWLGATLVGNLGAAAPTASGRQRVRAVATGVNNLGMGANFQAIKAQTQGCTPPGTTPALARAGLNAILFNDGSSAVSSDKTGDIGVVVFVVYRSDLNIPIAQAELFRCSDPECTATEALAEVSGPLQGEGDVFLAWQWLPSNNHVVVRADDNVVALPYAQTPIRPLSFRSIEALVAAPGCPDGARSSATAVTAVGNVFVIP